MRRFSAVSSRWRMAALCICVSALSCTSASARDARTERIIAAALVKIYVTSNGPDYHSPWQRIGVTGSSGSGVIIDGHRVLTAAHVVADQVAIEVKRAGGTRRFAAKVAHVGHACDLAVLDVADPDFFIGSKPLELGELPALRDRVDVYGFPEGGDRIAVTAGIVSRVETGAYVHSGEPLLQVQIDAAINSGNSGGPVIAGTSVVGIAAEALMGAENIGYMIPPPVIDHFLVDIKGDGRFDGFPGFGIEFRPLENDGHRQFLGLGDTDAGVLVTRINHGSPAAGVLHVGDVLTHINGVEVSRDGTVRLRGNDRVSFSHLVTSQQSGDEVGVSVVRDGKPHHMKLTVRRTKWLVPGPQYDIAPTYFVFGGLVFQPLTVDYLNMFGSWPSHLAFLAEHENLVTETRDQIVVLTQVLSHQLNRGYDEMAEQVVVTVNGTAVRNVRHLVQLIEASEQWARVSLHGGGEVVLDAEAARLAKEEILDAYDVTADRSVDLRAPAATPSGR